MFIWRKDELGDDSIKFISYINSVISSGQDDEGLPLFFFSPCSRIPIFR